MANNNTAIIVIGMILIVVLTMYGPVSADFGNLLDKLWNGWGDLFETDKQGEHGSLGLGVTIKFKDGTTQEYKPSGSNLFPLTIFIDGVEIESITWTIWMKADWTGTLDSLDATGDIEVWTMTGPILIGSSTINYNGVPLKNDWQEIDSLTLTDTEIESNLVEGKYSYVLEGYASSTMIFSFADGESTTMNPLMGPTQVFINWQTGGLTVFQVDFRSTNL